MAYHSTTTTDFAPGLWTGVKARLARVGSGLAQRLETYMRYRSRADQVERLQAMSDAELARRGIPRERIVHHVFRDVFYV